jgi:hypothetical protein
VADCGLVDEDGLILLQMWNCELWVEGAAQEQGEGRLGLRKIMCFFLYLYCSTP